MFITQTYLDIMQAVTNARGSNVWVNALFQSKILHLASIIRKYGSIGVAGGRLVKCNWNMSSGQSKTHFEGNAT